MKRSWARLNCPGVLTLLPCSGYGAQVRRVPSVSSLLCRRCLSQAAPEKQGALPSPAAVSYRVHGATPTGRVGRPPGKGREAGRRIRTRTAGHRFDAGLRPPTSCLSRSPRRRRPEKCRRLLSPPYRSVWHTPQAKCRTRLHANVAAPVREDRRSTSMGTVVLFRPRGRT